LRQPSCCNEEREVCLKKKVKNWNEEKNRTSSGIISSHSQELTIDLRRLLLLEQRETWPRCKLKRQWTRVNLQPRFITRLGYFTAKRLWLARHKTDETWREKPLLIWEFVISSCVCSSCASILWFQRGTLKKK
jgi:hypothetical protein